MKPTFLGKKVVFGVPETFKPIKGIPNDSIVTLRFSPKNVGIASFTVDGSICRYVIEDIGDSWSVEGKLKVAHGF